MLAGGELQVGSPEAAAGASLLTTLAVVGVVWVGDHPGLPSRGVLPPLPGRRPALPAILALGLLLGMWAANSSPDLTVAVIEENGCQGTACRRDPGRDHRQGRGGHRPLHPHAHPGALRSSIRPRPSASSAVVDLVREVGGALVVGAAVGWVFSLYLEKEGRQPPYATFLFAYLMVVVAEMLHVELLLTGVSPPASSSRTCRRPGTG